MRLIVVLVLFGLTACGGSSAPSPRKSGSSSGTGTPSAATPTAPRTGPLTTGPNVRPGEKPPELPNAAKQHDVTGALNFAIYYFKAVDWSFATNDSYLLRRVADPACRSCSRIAGRIDDLTKKRQVLKGDRLHYMSAEVVRGNFTITSDFVIKTTVRQDAGELLGSQDANSKSIASTSQSLVFVSWRASGWRVIEVGAPS